MAHIKIQNYNSGKEMEKSITSIIKQELYQEINNSPFWSIMIDETTSISDEKHLAIVSKHISHNVLVLRYIRLIERKNSVIIKLKELNSFFTSVYCISHRLHLAEKDTTNEVQYFKKYETVCKE